MISPARIKEVEMRFSDIFVPTLKEDPAEAEIASHKLLFRAGMLRKVAAGIYSFLPMGKRVLDKVERIVREEMDRIGAQEVLLPALQPSELWEASGRWAEYGPEMMRLQDRGGRDFCLGPTHEELITDLVMKEVRSYRQLPLTLYQIQVKFRDEIRPRFGLLRAREFLMKDAYSFHTDKAGLQKTYEDMSSAYSRIIERCGLEYRIVEAASGLIGGKVSQEFMVIADAGEDTVLFCDDCRYSANQEMARTKEEEIDKPADAGKASNARKVATPGHSTVEEVSRFLEVDPEKIVKTLIYRVDSGLVAVLVRGDTELNEVKLADTSGSSDIRFMTEEDFKDHSQLIPGFVGPVGLKDIPVYADQMIRNMEDFVVGANEKEAHLVDVNWDVDFDIDRWGDFHVTGPGERCPCCEGSLKEAKGIEIGHVFQLGTKYSEAMKAFYLDENGSLQPYIMGCYGIGVSRLMAAVIEQFHDERGIIWPYSVAPYQVVIIPVNWEIDEQRQVGEQIYNRVLGAGLEVLIDDRKVSPGVKFAEADLIGFPLQVVVGKRGLERGIVEVKHRLGLEKEEIEITKAAERIISLVREGLSSLNKED
jgi:prolyl-tRNA synthetase